MLLVRILGTLASFRRGVALLALLAVIVLPGRWDRGGPAEAHTIAGVEIIDTAALVTSHSLNTGGNADANPGSALLIDTIGDTVADAIVVPTGTTVRLVAHAHTGTDDAANGTDVIFSVNASGTSAVFQAVGRDTNADGALDGTPIGSLTSITDSQAVIAQTVSDTQDGGTHCDAGADTCIDGANAGTPDGIALVEVRSDVPTSSTITAASALGTDSVAIIWTGVKAPTPTVELVGYVPDNDTSDDLPQGPLCSSNPSWTTETIDKASFDEVLEAEDLWAAGNRTGSTSLSTAGNIVWLFGVGSSVFGTFSVPGDTVAVQFGWSDCNDGLVDVIVDGQVIVNDIDTWAQGNWYVEISNLPNTIHTVEVRVEGYSIHGGLHGQIDAFAVKTSVVDSDGDGIRDAEDNCPAITNPGQQDTDGDDLGDACDPDDDNDGFSDTDELLYSSDPLNALSTPEHHLALQTCSDGADNDLDGSTDMADSGCRRTATTDVEQALIEKYSPVLFLAEGDYQPEEVQIMLNEEGRHNCFTALYRHISVPGLPDENKLITDCPTSRDLFVNSARFTVDRFPFRSIEVDHYLDIDGANPGDDEAYQQLYWGVGETPGLANRYEPVAYADVREKPESGLVLIDYWFFYFYNENHCNPVVCFDHEGDWERIQVRIEASTVSDALDMNPVSDPSSFSAAYSVHTCARDSNLQVRSWSDLTVGGGTHPWVYVADGSHANYFEEGLHPIPLGCGVGFDNTVQGVPLRPRPILIDCDSRNTPPSDQRWLKYTGKWGEWSSGPVGPCDH